MSVDVEDWFQVQAFAGVLRRADWDGLERRVEANTDRVLDLFAGAGVRATFFTLGWVAERHPALVRRIVAAGHELASHGHGHEPPKTWANETEIQMYHPPTPPSYYTIDWEGENPGVEWDQHRYPGLMILHILFMSFAFFGALPAGS